MIPIESLPNLPDAVNEYVERQVTERKQDILSLPPEPKDILVNCTNHILDVGPGEGISTMALAELAGKAEVVGVEMDRKHLAAAWPKCNTYTNLKLYFGCLPGTPSNPLIDRDVPHPPTANFQEGYFPVLFSYLGMSRRDIFEGCKTWSPIVADACVLIAPRFWREGLRSLPHEDQLQLEILCNNLGILAPNWQPYLKIYGFTHIKCYPLGQRMKARGWILWLSGIFDKGNVSLWDTLVDRWSESPRYQLTDMLLELEAIVALRH